MAVTTKKTFSAANGSTKSFGPIGIELNNQDDLDVYVTLSGGTRRLSLRQSSDTTATSSHPQVNDTTGLYFPAVSVGDQLYNYSISTDNNNIVFNNNLPSGAVVSCERRTRDSSSNYTNFSGGSTIRSTDLNTAFDESNFTAQEARNKGFDLEKQLHAGTSRQLFQTDTAGTGIEWTSNIDIPGTLDVTGATDIDSTLNVDGNTTVGGNLEVSGTFDVTGTSNYTGQQTVPGGALVKNIRVGLDGASEVSTSSGNLTLDSATGTVAVDDALTVAGSLTVTGTTNLANDSIGTAEIDSSIVDGNIAAGASIAHTKLAGAAGGKVLLGNSSNVVTATTVSGDVTINSSGVTAITAGSIVEGDIANNAVTTAKITDSNVTTAKIAADAITSAKIADDAVSTEHYAAGSVNNAAIGTNAVNSDQIAANAVTTAKIAADAVDSTKIADGSVYTVHLQNDLISTQKIANNAVTAAKIADEVIVTASEQAAASANDTTFFTTSASDARYFNVSTGDTIKDGDAFPDNDTTIATTAAINDRIIDLVDDVGGFVPIANETSFPNANPDVNNGTGTLVSIKALASNLTSNGSGVATIANGTVGNSTVTITGLANSTTYAANFGMIVETTTTLNTYTFHRQVPIATEVSTVAASISNVNTVAGAVVNVNAVAGNATNINAVAGNNSNITSVAGNASNINSAVSNASNINSAVSNASNINTTAGSISNVNTVAGSISNVNEVATNMGSVNDFAARYRTGANNPTSSLDTGDLFFNTSANELKVYNGSAWQGGVTASGNFASTTGNTWTGDNLYNDGVKAKFGTGSDLQIYHDGSQSWIKETGSAGQFIIDGYNGTDIRYGALAEHMIRAIGGAQVELYYDNAKKLETSSTGGILRGTMWTAVDNTKVAFGTGDDLQIFHDGSHSYIKDTGTGELRLASNQFTVQNAAADETLLYAVENGAVGLKYDDSLKLETKSYGLSLHGNVLMTNTDNQQLKLGAGNDLVIYHNGTDSWIKNTTGVLVFGGPDIQLANVAGNEQYIRAVENGAVNLYYDNSKKFETTSSGITVNSRCAFAGSAIYDKSGTGNSFGISFSSTGLLPTNGSGTETNNTYNLGSASYSWHDLFLGDDGKATFGAGSDLQIYHNGSNSIIQHSGTGDLYVQTAQTDEDLFLIGGSSVFMKPAGGADHGVKAIKNGAVELYYDGSKKLDTVSGGINVVGYVNVQSGGHVYLEDSGKVLLGTSSDLQLYHDGSNSYIDNNTGTLNILAATDISMWANNSERTISGIANGAVELFYDGVRKAYTNSGGFALDSHLIMGDSDIVKLGNGADLQLYHDGGSSVIRNTNNNASLYLQGSSSGTNNIKCYANGGTVIYWNGETNLYTEEDAVRINDNVVLELGNASDLQIYHNGSDSWIKNHTGVLVASTADFQVASVAGDEQMIRAYDDSHVHLYYDNSEKFRTTSSGVQIYGQTASNNGFYLNNGSNIVLEDNGEAIFGNSSDLKIYHSGSDSVIDKTTAGNLLIYVANDFYLKHGTEVMLAAKDDAEIALYYDGSEKFITKSTGVQVQANNDIRFNSGSTWTGDACKITNHGNWLYIQGGSNGHAIRRNSGADVWYFDSTGHFFPATNNAYDIGTSSNRVRNIYVNDLQLSNESKKDTGGNDVDGTWGDWTLQEGEEDIFMINNRSGKKYKMALQEVS